MNIQLSTQPIRHPCGYVWLNRLYSGRELIQAANAAGLVVQGDKFVIEVAAPVADSGIVIEAPKKRRRRR